MHAVRFCVGSQGRFAMRFRSAHDLSNGSLDFIVRTFDSDSCQPFQLIIVCLLELLDSSNNAALNLGSP